MSRATTKTELLQAAEQNYERLSARLAGLPQETLLLPGINGEQNIKDVLAHLHAWQTLFFSWYAEGMAGGSPQMPAPGYTWKTTPALNQQLYLQYREMPLPEVRRKLDASHHQLLEMLHQHTDEELFTKKLYPWTKSTHLGAYFISAAPSHYDWADGLVRKFLKAIGG